MHMKEPIVFWQCELALMFYKSVFWQIDKIQGIFFEG